MNELPPKNENDGAPEDIEQVKAERDELRERVEQLEKKLAQFLGEVGMDTAELTAEPKDIQDMAEMGVKMTGGWSDMSQATRDQIANDAFKATVGNMQTPSQPDFQPPAIYGADTTSGTPDFQPPVAYGSDTTSGSPDFRPSVVFGADTTSEKQLPDTYNPDTTSTATVEDANGNVNGTTTVREVYGADTLSERPDVPQIEKKPENDEPKDMQEIIAGALDITKEADAVAHDAAQKMWQEARDKKGKLGKIFWGITDNFMHEYRIQKYTEDARKMIDFKQGKGREGMSEQEVEARLKEINEVIPDDIWNPSKAGIKRFVDAHVNGFESAMIHSENGEKMSVYGVEKDEKGVEHVYKYGSVGEDGKRSKELADDTVEGKATKDLRDAIAAYAKSDKSEKDALLDFQESVKIIKQNLLDAGGSPDGLQIDNYEEIAIAAKERVTHEMSIENVLEGFKMINGEAHRNVRTERYMNAREKITHSLIQKGGHLISPTAIAVGVSTGAWLMKSSSTGVLRKVIPGAGMITAGIYAGARESDRVAEDINAAARAGAKGVEVTGDTKYDKQIRETMYDAEPATELTESLTKYLDENGNIAEGVKAEDALSSLAKVNALISQSDRRKIDLIKYSDGDVESIEQQRMDLDVARARMEVALKRAGIEAPKIADAIDEATESLNENIDAKDKLRKQLRRKRALMKGAVAIGTSAATMVAGQEIVAAFSADKYGLVDMARGETLAEGQQTTILGGLGNKIHTWVHGSEIADAKPTYTTIVENGKLSDTELRQYSQNQDYTITSKTTKIPGETVTQEQQVGLKEYIDKEGKAFKRNWANNGTKFSDGNELRGQISEAGEVTMRFSGNSTMPGGETVDVAQAAAEGRIKVALSLTKESQGHPIIIDAVADGNGGIRAVSEDPTIRDLIANRNFSTLEVFVDNGVTEDGIMQGTAIATAIGRGAAPETTFTEIISQQLPDTWQTTYTVVQENIPTEAAANEFMSGFGIPIGARKGMTLGKGRAIEGSAAPRTPENPTPTGNSGTPGETPVSTTFGPDTTSQSPEQPTGTTFGPDTTSENPEQPTATTFGPDTTTQNPETPTGTPEQPTGAAFGPDTTTNNPEGQTFNPDTTTEQLSYDELEKTYNDQFERYANWDRNLESVNGDIRLVAGANANVYDDVKHNLVRDYTEGRVSQEDYQRLTVMISQRERQNRDELIRREADHRLQARLQNEPNMSEADQAAFREQIEQEMREVPSVRMDIPNTQYTIQPGERQNDGSMRGISYVDQLLAHYKDEFRRRFMEAQAAASREQQPNANAA